jgi:hypothetical protein
VTKPPELDNAEMVDAICRRYSALPSAVLAEDGYTLLQMLAMLGEE